MRNFATVKAANARIERRLYCCARKAARFSSVGLGFARDSDRQMPITLQFCRMLALDSNIKLIYVLYMLR
jgi:hypothetical protein